MPYVLIWPEAQSKYDEYNNIITRLSELKANISYVADSGIYSKNIFIDSSFSGEYYNIYKSCLNDWYDDVITIWSEFIKINNELNIRINNAKTLKDLWQGRIGKTRWEEDK